MFWLLPHETPAHPQRGSPRMFRVEWIERYLSRVRPWHVLVVWVPVALWFAGRAVAAVGLVAAAGLVLAGVIGWTLLEYVLHRWVFHAHPNPDSEWQKDLSFMAHGVHHDWPYDPDRLVMPPVVAVLIALLVGLPLHAALGAAVFPGVFAGLIAGYVWYDMTHYAVHHLKQRTALGRLQRRDHLVHHFAQPDARFGVTSPVWDVVFRTYPPLPGAAAGQPGGEPRRGAA